MLNILSTCSATVRKSLQGLDYIAANGSKAFDDLCAAVTRLQECGAISRESKDEWQSSLISGKHYLKLDYKVKYSRYPSLSCHWRSQRRYIIRGVNIHIFVITDLKNNRFQKKLIVQNTIYE